MRYTVWSDLPDYAKTILPYIAYREASKVVGCILDGRVAMRLIARKLQGRVNGITLSKRLAEALATAGMSTLIEDLREE